MASSYQDRLKARRGGGVKKKKSTKQLKLNEKRKIKLFYETNIKFSKKKNKIIKKNTH